MKIKFLGHASFLITTAEGTRLQFDPYEPGGFNGAIGYGPFTEAADIVVVSHDHADHGCVAAVPGKPLVVTGANSQNIRGVELLRHKTYHDANQGGKRGENIVTVCRAEGLSVCHLGDLGHLLSAEDVKALGKVEVLLAPVGGLFTIDAEAATKVMASLSPRICIPMHYKTPKAGFPIAPIDGFLQGKKNVKRLGTNEVEISVENLPKETEIWVLEPAL
jgi:L-ascorbate metabolism protein UlaG (beta-lactamase superfamily)